MSKNWHKMFKSATKINFQGIFYKRKLVCIGFYKCMCCCNNIKVEDEHKTNNNRKNIVCNQSFKIVDGYCSDM